MPKNATFLLILKQVLRRCYDPSSKIIADQNPQYAPKSLLEALRTRYTRGSRFPFGERGNQAETPPSAPAAGGATHAQLRMAASVGIFDDDAPTIPIHLQDGVDCLRCCH